MACLRGVVHARGGGYPAPTAPACEAALQQYMPELVTPVHAKLTGLAGGSDRRLRVSCRHGAL